MTLDLEDEYGLDLGFDYEKTATEVINQVLEEEGCPYEAQVNLLLTSDPEIHRMNMISLDKVKEQAEKYNHSVRREFAFLVAHSMLHLLGYDHMTPEEAKDMESRQSAALEHLGITRD